MKLAFALAIVLAACGGSQKPPHATDKCPDSPPCLTTPSCTYDAKRDCEACRCTAPPYVPPEQTDPRSPPP